MLAVVRSLLLVHTSDHYVYGNDLLLAVTNEGNIGPDGTMTGRMKARFAATNSYYEGDVSFSDEHVILR